MEKKKGIELAIERSVEGGYGDGKVEFFTSSLILTVSENSKHWAEVLLDPKFWKCLGKQQGWEDWSKRGQRNYFTSLDYWHDFIDHRAKGGDTDEFFNNLLNDK